MSTFVRDVFSVLWACRVSVASVVAAFLLFCLTTQARDLLLEVHVHVDSQDQLYNPLQLKDRVFWATFFFLVVFMWALPVHFAARYVLSGSGWLRVSEFDDATRESVLRQRRFELIIWIPRLLGLGCFVAIGVGLWWVWADLPSNTTVRETAAVAQHLTSLFYINIIVAAAFILFIAKRRWAIRCLAILAQRLGFASSQRGKLTNFVMKWFGVGYLIIVLLLLVLMIAFPTVASRIPRALMIPVLLGGWVPALSVLAYCSHRFRAPIVTIALLAIITLGAFLPGRHAIVTFEHPNKEYRPIALSDAVKSWANANGCKLDDKDHVQRESNCPHPIVVIASGGASRAAYFTASALGTLFDATCKSEGERSCTRYPTMARRLFALSTVSGSSLAAITVGAALRHSARDGTGKFPCQKVSDPASLWRLEGPPDNWRDCLQSLTAGDYLSPAMLGLVFRDPTSILLQAGSVIGLGGADSSDRGRLLETAWQTRYLELVNEPDDKGLAQPFSDVAPTIAENTEEPWRPLLILNGTSVATGRRVLTTHLATKLADGRPLFSDAYDIYELLDRCFPGAGYELKGPRPRVDISLATAALNSARFPLVSPDGAIFIGENTCDRIVDGGYFENYGAIAALELIEALEEFGLSPVVLSVTNNPEMAIDPDLDPLDRRRPIPDIDEEVWFSSLLVPLQGALATRDAVGTFGMSKLRARLSREPSGRGQIGADRSTLALQKLHCPVFGGDEVRIAEVSIVGEIGPRGEMKDLSMSWWLSGLVQAALDRSVRSNANLCQLAKLCDTLDAGEAAMCWKELDKNVLVN